jgi:hypothetical protein
MFRWKTTAMNPHSARCGSTHRNSFATSCFTCCRADSSVSVTTGSSATGAAKPDSPNAGARSRSYRRATAIDKLSQDCRHRYDRLAGRSLRDCPACARTHGMHRVPPASRPAAGTSRRCAVTPAAVTLHAPARTTGRPSRSHQRPRDLHPQ